MENACPINRAIHLRMAAVPRVIMGRHEGEGQRSSARRAIEASMLQKSGNMAALAFRRGDEGKYMFQTTRTATCGPSHPIALPHTCGPSNPEPASRRQPPTSNESAGEKQTNRLLLHQENRDCQPCQLSHPPSAALFGLVYFHASPDAGPLASNIELQGTKGGRPRSKNLGQFASEFWIIAFGCHEGSDAQELSSAVRIREGGWGSSENREFICSENELLWLRFTVEILSNPADATPPTYLPMLRVQLPPRRALQPCTPQSSTIHPDPPSPLSLRTPRPPVPSPPGGPPAPGNRPPRAGFAFSVRAGRCSQ
ncbi:hypothetical protein BDK51DRAFT_43915 [Blyttiomyces helicus]|uniref:Uncharacterized protein n=1 Tax=Blyttiomyces helicus TaxID=388810 RepID=A0A4P9VTE2_9FUNG|nr:hypothetical protein BDK51DRAFT_43915 [Blyttiomyces helicus]|eukprot:RKO82791.1 hypothetical protein BDK51DRAFT_43915 [Blyttiomyces helicus]